MKCPCGEGWDTEEHVTVVGSLDPGGNNLAGRSCGRLWNEACAGIWWGSRSEKRLGRVLTPGLPRHYSRGRPSSPLLPATAQALAPRSLLRASAWLLAIAPSLLFPVAVSPQTCCGQNVFFLKCRCDPAILLLETSHRLLLCS